MVTILTTVKPFQGNDGLRQRNALISWLAMAPDVEVIVFAPAPGIEPVVSELGLRYYPEVPCIEGRLPRVDAIFEIAQREGRHDLQAFVNGDIVLFEDFVRALHSIPQERFLMIGRRWGTPVLEVLERDRPEQLADFRERALSHGWYARGVEYFGYRRGTLQGLPPMCPGATAWDDMMVAHCLERKIPVIDATCDVLCIHQDHEVFRTATSDNATVCSPAAEHNLRLAGDRALPCIEDASHVLRRGRVWPAWTSLWHVRHRLRRLPERSALWRPFREPVIRVFKLLKRLQAPPGAYYRTAARRPEQQRAGLGPAAQREFRE